jgi:hypothetical protein
MNVNKKNNKKITKIATKGSDESYDRDLGLAM